MAKTNSCNYLSNRRHNMNKTCFATKPQSKNQAPSTSLPSRLHNSTRHDLRQRPTLSASPTRFIPCKLHHGGLDLRPKICTMERTLTHNFPANLAVPAQAVETAFGAGLLEHDTDGGGEPDGVVRRVGGGQEDYFALADGQVAEHGVDRVRLILAAWCRGIGGTDRGFGLMCLLVRRRWGRRRPLVRRGRVD